MKLKTLLKKIENDEVEIMNDIQDKELQVIDVRNIETGKRKNITVERS